jgi:hypothetical protein
MNRKLLASAMTVGALSAPVAIAVADENDSNANPSRSAVQQRAVDLSRLDEGHAQSVRRQLRDDVSDEREARAEKRAKKRAEKRAAAAASAGGQGAQTSGASTASPALESIAACESGGNPGAVGGGGAYRGKYQFDQQTWASVGGSGDPAAAPEAEQDKRAAMLYARAGASPWPVCGQ